VELNAHGLEADCSYLGGLRTLGIRDPLVVTPALAARFYPKMRKMQDQIEIAEKHYVILQHFFGNILSSMRSTKRPKLS